MQSVSSQCAISDAAVQLVVQQCSQCAISDAAVQSVCSSAVSSAAVQCAVQQWMWQCSAVQQWVRHRASCIGDIRLLVGASSGACDKTISAAIRLMSAGERQE